MARYRYMRIGAWKYWVSGGRVLFANRQPLPPAPETVACNTLRTEPSLEAASATAYGLLDQTGPAWLPFQCPTCEAWHVVEVASD